MVAANNDYEEGKIKIALYFDFSNQRPTHAARQLTSGLWTSKLGDNMDLSHELHELEGPEYGNVFRVFEKNT